MSLRRFIRLAAALAASTALAVSAALALAQPRAGDGGQLTILVSFDGWRWDYDTKAPAPALRALTARGVRAEALIPSFPSKTFPNHYTIVTGLYPGRHGIVANNIWDDPTGRMFTLARREEVRDAMWWGGEPIWVTAEKAGQRVAPLYWPGSEPAAAASMPASPVPATIRSADAPLSLDARLWEPSS